jgi:gliding motility-associated-like protein
VPNQQISENAPATSLTIKDISKGPLEESQQLTFVVTSSNTTIIENPGIQYNGTGTTAVLSFAVKPNASGLVSITIAAIDNGLNTPPHQNSYSSSFQVEVLEVNTAPTLDVINDLTLMEDAELQNITLTGISAGPGETQALSVTVTSSNADFFERLDVSYTSPAPTALLQFQPRKNVFGTVQLSVTVTDNGSGAAPHVNTVTRSFKIVVQPVNDAPVFTSTPVTLGVIGELYEYRITAADLDAEKITITAPVKPSWAVLTSGPNGEAKLSGTPPDGSVGNVPVTLQVNDAASSVSQSFTIFVNIRPVVSSLSMVTAEDIPTPLQVSFFQNGYADANDNPLMSVSITTVPSSGKLLLSGQEIKASDTIPASSLTTLVYSPNENFFGMDFFGWTASDGYHFSLAASRVDISVLPVNDAPLIRFQNDTLHYEVNGEPDFISPLARIIDPDDDTLTNAVVGFHARNYRPEADVLEFQNTTNIRGTFDFQSGILKLTGSAPLLEYQSALRTVRYLHRNTLDPLLEPKGVYFLVNDGDVESVTKDKIIMLKYTFIEFDIPSGFTPNNDQANDVWVINRPGGGLEEMDDAIISVYNKRGVLVFRTRGFDHPWDGTMNGELLPADTYFFTIDLKLRNRKTYKGIVTLLR